MMGWMLLLGSALTSVQAEPTRIALVIANNQSLDENVEPLRFADDDAARLFELLRGLGYQSKLLATLDGESASRHPEVAPLARPPTWQRLEQTVRALKKVAQSAHRAGREVELLVAFSGHGAVGSGGDPYLSLLDRRLSRGELFRQVAAGVGADSVHVIIDACRARDFVNARVGPDGPDFRRVPSLFPAKGHPEFGILVAESGDVKTHEWSRTHSGVFAHELFSGLSGAADVNRDGKIEYSEMHSFVAAANASIKDPRARLHVVAQAPPRNPRQPLINLDAAGMQRVQTPDRGGWFSIEDDRGVRWVDAHLARGTQVTIHLPPRPWYFVTDLREATEAIVEPRPGGPVVALASAGFEPVSTAASRSSLTEALGSDLFRTPFGSDYYGGFVVAVRYPSVLDDLEAPVAGVEPQESKGAAPGGRSETDADSGPGSEELKLHPDAVGLGPTDGLEYSPSSPWTGWRVARWVLVGIGAVALGIGIYYGVSANDLANDYQALWRPGSGFEESLGDAAREKALIADISFLVAVFAGGAWGASWFFEEI